MVGSGSSDTNVDLTLSAKGTGVVHSTTPIQVQTDTVVTTKTLTTTATTADQVIGAFAGATFRSAEFVIQAIDATGTKYQKTKILAEMKSSMKLSKVLFVLVAMLFGNSVYSQSKKEQIESLNYKIDSLVQVIQCNILL